MNNNNGTTPHIINSNTNNNNSNNNNNNNTVARQTNMGDFVMLNVGGTHFATTRATLCACAGSMLATMFGVLNLDVVVVFLAFSSSLTSNTHTHTHHLFRTQLGFAQLCN
jgi:hypothetical protein